MAILVDTSVWIKFIANRLEAAETLASLLANEEVAGHPFVYGELLVGDPGGRLPLLRDYPFMTEASILGHDEVVEFVRLRRLHGRGVGWIDVHLLASALVNKMPLWTTDPRLRVLAEELSVAYHPPA